MRIIITSRDNFLLTTGHDMVHSLVKVEVKSLNKESANDLVRMCTKQVPLRNIFYDFNDLFFYFYGKCRTRT